MHARAVSFWLFPPLPLSFFFSPGYFASLVNPRRRRRRRPSNYRTLAFARPCRRVDSSNPLKNDLLHVGRIYTRVCLVRPSVRFDTDPSKRSSPLKKAHFYSFFPLRILSSGNPFLPLLPPTLVRQFAAIMSRPRPDR